MSKKYDRKTKEWVEDAVREEERYRSVMTIALTVLISGLIAIGVMLVKIY